MELLNHSSSLVNYDQIFSSMFPYNQKMLIIEKFFDQFHGIH